MSTNTEFIPPLFKKFGQSLTDLFKEQFEYKKQLKIKTTTASGVSLQSGAEVVGKTGADFAGHVKSTYKQADIGTFETELHTLGSAKYSVKADRLTKGLTIKASGDEKPAGKVEIDYAQEYFSSSFNVDVSKAATSVEAAGVVGFDGLSVGGQFKYDITGQRPSDFNAGAEYAQPDFTVTVKTTEQANKIATSYLHKLSPQLTVGAQFAYDIESSKRLATVGGSYRIDAFSFTKLKVDTNGVLATVLEHRLPNPRVKLIFSSEYNAKQLSSVPEKVGLSLNLGDD